MRSSILAPSGADLNEGFDRQEQLHQPVVDIALCICPHLDEFLAIDQRKHLPGRPLVKLLHADSLFDENFYEQVERYFSYALRHKGQPFTTMIALPQVLQEVIRQVSLQSLLQTLGHDIAYTPEPTISILLFSGEYLDLNEEELRKTIESLLGSERDAWTVEMAQHSLASLIAKEQKFEQNMEQGRIRSMIRGDIAEFLTIWQQSP